MKICNICGQNLPITEFSKKDKKKWKSFCRNCNSIKNAMLKAKVLEVPELEKGKEIEVRGKNSNGKSYSYFVAYDKALQLVEERAAYVVNPKLIRKYFDGETFRKLVLKRYGDSCFYCGDIANTIDHVIPKSQGGISSFSNCVPACSDCNQAKGNIDIEEFLYYYEPSTTIPGVSRTDSIRYGLLELTEKVENINTYLNICLKKIEMIEDDLKDIGEMEELMEKVNEITKTIARYKKEQIHESLV